jgi:hypothetical protein
MEVDITDARLAEDSDDITYIDEMQRLYRYPRPARTPGSVVETLGCIPTAPASSWMWLWGTPLHLSTACPRRHQMSPPSMVFASNNLHVFLGALVVGERGAVSLSASGYLLSESGVSTPLSSKLLLLALRRAFGEGAGMRLWTLARL